MSVLNQTALAFLHSHGLDILHPLMYQFFVMQGMGLLEPMSCYYMVRSGLLPLLWRLQPSPLLIGPHDMTPIVFPDVFPHLSLSLLFFQLKWCSPKSMSAGGFGNDQDTPLAMLKEGFGGLLHAMVDDIRLDVRLNHTVAHIERTAASGVYLTFSNDPNQPQIPAEHCDLLVLSGAIPKLLSHNILQHVTVQEQATFGTMRPMQFLVSLLELPVANTTHLPFKALEYWPDGYQQTGGVIVRRDIGYAETTETTETTESTESTETSDQHRDQPAGKRTAPTTYTHQSHRIGGLQTFSYNGDDPAVSNYTTHWQSQVQWMKDYKYNPHDVRVLQQFWVDSYYYHWRPADIRHVWDIQGMQMLHDTRTLYVGGSASYETVEDSFQHNLELVKTLIDQQRYPLPIRTPMVEQYVYTVPCNRLEEFMAVSHQTWDAFLQRTPGFVKKYYFTPPATLTTGNKGTQGMQGRQGRRGRQGRQERQERQGIQGMPGPTTAAATYLCIWNGAAVRCGHPCPKTCGKT
jgi:hypothetical protein